MAGIIILLILSWLLLWLTEKQHRDALGLLPARSRLLQLLFGFFTAAVCCAIYYQSFTLPAGNHWVFHRDFTASKMLSSAWWTFRSVLTEELLFRGSLLCISIKFLGTKKACLLSACAFGIYHWFTMGAFGNPLQMFFLFCMTAVWGFMLAMAFAETRSLYLPIGIHFGWNLVNTVVFSQGPLGEQLFSLSGGKQLGGVLSLVVFLFQVFAVPLIVYAYLKKRGVAKQENMHRETRVLSHAAGTPRP